MNAMESAPRDGTVILGLEKFPNFLRNEPIVVPIRFEDGEWLLAWTIWGDETSTAHPIAWLPMPELT